MSAAQHLCDDASNGGEEKGSGPLRVFGVVQSTAHRDFDRDVTDPARKAGGQCRREFLLTAKNPVRRSMADKHDAIVRLGKFLRRTGQRIEASGEEQYL